MRKIDHKSSKIIKEYSRKNYPEERKKVAGEIILSRKERDIARKNLRNMQQKSDELYELKRISEEQLDEIKDQRRKLSKNLPSKIFNYLKLCNLRQEIKIKEAKWDESYDELSKWNKEEYLRRIELENEIREYKKEAKSIVEEFYKNIELEWSKEDFDLEDVKKYFTENDLANLSLDDYISLLRRFPCSMATNVVRQGIRDHIYMNVCSLGGHTVGEGKFHNDFKIIIESGKLHSILSHIMTSNEEKKLLKHNFIDNKPEEFFTNPKEFERVIKYYQDMITKDNFEFGDMYADKLAVHFAIEEVADEIYGAETANEMFFVYPTLLFVNDFYYKGNLGGMCLGQMNDTWVWHRENQGIDINAGLVFIPKNCQVDPKTGSRYLVENGQAVIHQKDIDYLTGLVQSEFSQNILKSKIINEIHEEGSKKNYSFEQRYDLIAVKKIPELLGLFKSTKLQMAYYGVLEHLNANEYHNNNEHISKLVIRKMKYQSAYYKEPKETISSYDYWEKYFKNNPGHRPSKIVYYEENNPTAAINNFKKRNKLSQKDIMEIIDWFEDKSAYNNTDIIRARQRETIDLIIELLWERKKELEEKKNLKA